VGSQDGICCDECIEWLVERIRSITLSTSVTIHSEAGSSPIVARQLPALITRWVETWRAPDGPAIIFGVIGCLALLIGLFWANLLHFVYVWSTDQNYGHGFLVPIISLYFANEAAKRGPGAFLPATRLGCGLLAISILGRVATTVVPLGFIGDIAFLIGVAGVTALLGGRAALYRYGFALTFLIFMVPLPIHLYTTIANPLQLMVSKAAARILTFGGIPVFCEGNHLTLPGGVRMFVAEACSGMRQLTGFLALTTAVAFLSHRPVWYRLILVASSVPIALAANVTRVVATGWLMSVNPSYAQGAMHTVEGLLMMGLGLGILNLECRALNVVASLWTTAPSKEPSQVTNED
jgi:exosortase